MSSTGVLTIDLKAISDNWRLLNTKVGEKTECSAVVKANAYGLGLSEVSAELKAAGCKTFFVVTLVEAIELRTYVGDSPEIFVLGGVSQDAARFSRTLSDDWVKFRLTPVLFSVEYIEQWGNYCSSIEKLLPCIIKLDTGMHRLGLSENELIEVLNSGLLSLMSPKYLMSHFACADDPEHPLNDKQVESFERCSSMMKEVYPDIRLSLANSSGVFLGKKAHYDLVRPGCALYGVNPTPAALNPMKPVINIQLPIVQMKTIHVGESVGYGATFVAARTTRLAIVFGGYADGLLRYLSNTGFAYYDGAKIPLIGRVSMDSMVFDVTDAQISEDRLLDQINYINVLGEYQSVDALAEMAGTIAYEILTSLGHRFARRYING